MAENAVSAPTALGPASSASTSPPSAPVSLSSASFSSAAATSPPSHPSSAGFATQVPPISGMPAANFSAYQVPTASIVSATPAFANSTIVNVSSMSGGFLSEVNDTSFPTFELNKTSYFPSIHEACELEKKNSTAKRNSSQTTSSSFLDLRLRELFQNGVLTLDRATQLLSQLKDKPLDEIKRILDSLPEKGNKSSSTGDNCQTSTAKGCQDGIGSSGTESIGVHAPNHTVSGGPPQDAQSMEAASKVKHAQDKACSRGECTITDSEVDSVVHRFAAFCAVGYFTGGTPSYKALSKWISDNWIRQNVAFTSFHNLGNNFFLFRFKSADALSFVLQKPSWAYYKTEIIIQRWTVDFDPETSNLAVLPIWISFPGLRPIFWPFVAKIAASLGTIIQVANIGSSTGDSKPSVRIALNLALPILDHVKINYKGRVYNQPVEYYGLPNCCFYCKLSGHRVNSCPALKLKEERKQQQSLSRSCTNNDYNNSLDDMSGNSSSHQKEQMNVVNGVTMTGGSIMIIDGLEHGARANLDSREHQREWIEPKPKKRKNVNNPRTCDPSKDSTCNNTNTRSLENVNKFGELASFDKEADTEMEVQDDVRQDSITTVNSTLNKKTPPYHKSEETLEQIIADVNMLPNPHADKIVGDSNALGDGRHKCGINSAATQATAMTDNEMKVDSVISSDSTEVVNQAVVTTVVSSAAPEIAPGASLGESGLHG